MKTIVLFALVSAALCASGKVIFKKTEETVLLDCGVEGASSLMWSRENDVLFSRRSHGLLKKGKSAIQSRCILRQHDLEIKRLSLADAGRFKCKVDGNEQETRLVVFSVYVSPSHELQLASRATLHCDVKPEVAVRWQGPDGGVRSESAEVQLDPVVQQDAGTWTCSLSDGDSTHTEHLEVTVKEPRPTTTSPPSRISGNVMGSPGEADSESQPDDSVSPAKIGLLGIALWMWAVIGGGSLVVALLLAILIFCVCRMVRRRRRLARKMKNGHQFRTPVQYCQCDGPTAAANPQQRHQRAKPLPPPLHNLLVE